MLEGVKCVNNQNKCKYSLQIYEWFHSLEFLKMHLDNPLNDGQPILSVLTHVPAKGDKYLIVRLRKNNKH